MRAATLSTLFAVVAATRAAATAPSEPAVPGNPALGREIGAGAVGSLDAGAPRSFDAWATSSLASPEPARSPDAPQRFGPFSLRDGRSSTAWCEGAPGDGAGEIVVGPRLVGEQPVEIWIGYGKSPALFRANGRPRRVRVHLIGAAASEVAQRTSGEAYRDLHVVASRDVTLEDVDAFQPLPLPAIPEKDARVFGFARRDVEGGGRLFPAIEILEAIAGERYHDTCITDVRQVPPAEERGRAVVLRTPWPAVLPCATLDTLTSGVDPSAIAEWRSSAEVVTISDHGGWIGPVGPALGEVSLVLPAAVGPDEWPAWGVACARGGTGSIAWRCAADGCAPAATYPAPGAKGAAAGCARDDACARLASGAFAGRPDAKDVARLEAVAKGLARDLGAAVGAACLGGRCSDAFAEVGRLAGRLPGAAWTLDGTGPLPQDEDGVAGQGATFRAARVPGTVVLRCFQSTVVDADVPLCRLELTSGGVAVRYKADPDRGTRYVKYGRDVAIVDPNDGGWVSLGGVALRTRTDPSGPGRHERGRSSGRTR